MQRVELSSYRDPLYCPFCGNKTIGERKISPCEHTLFIATDEGLEYCSERLDRNELENQAEDSSWDEATDGLDYPDSLKFAIYIPAPSFFGSYVGYVAKSVE